MLLGKGQRPRVADFGLARLGAGHRVPVAEAGAHDQSGEKLAAPLTRAGAISGTPGYMSPEQYSGGAVDARSDQFSFCAALYEALYGQLPFAGDTIAELAANTLAGKVLPRPAETTIPPEVHQAILRGLATEPSDRFPAMRQLLAALRLEQGHTIGGAAVARRRFVNIFIATMVIINLVMQTRLDTRAMTMRDVVVADAVTFAILCGFGVIWRNTLLRNAFHRRIWLGLAAFLIPRLIVVLIGVQYHVELVPFMAMDVVTMAGCLGLLAVLMLPGVWWVALFLFVVGIVTALVGANALWLNVMAHSIAGGGLAIVWNSAADRAQREALGLSEES